MSDKETYNVLQQYRLPNHFKHYGKLIINIDFPGPWFSKNKINGICVSKFAQPKMWGKFDKKICYKKCPFKRWDRWIERALRTLLFEI
jgi:hypothetical protein